MASNNRSSGTAAFRYASALVDLAMGQNSVPQLEKDVADLQSMIAASADLQTLIRSPLIKKADQQAALAALSEKAGFLPLTKNFLLTVAKNRRLAQIESILKAVHDSISARRGELRAKVESAFELTADQKKTLEDTLSKSVGGPVSVDASVNKELIGGVVVTLGSLMIDDSIKTKLARLNRAMKYEANQAA